LWLEYKIKAARKKAARWEAEAVRLEGLYLEAMRQHFPWAYDSDGEPLSDEEREIAAREAVKEWKARKESAVF
jgi:hypothetical protein